MKLAAPRTPRSDRSDQSRRTIRAAWPTRLRSARSKWAGHNRRRVRDATNSAAAAYLSMRASATHPKSRREAIDLPRAFGLARVAKPIVQAIRAALPKFDCVRIHPIPTPMRREQNLALMETLLHFFEPGIKDLPGIDHLTLLRRPRA